MLVAATKKHADLLGVGATVYVAQRASHVTAALEYQKASVGAISERGWIKTDVYGAWFMPIGRKRAYESGFTAYALRLFVEEKE
jgi:hypothetical protein